MFWSNITRLEFWFIRSDSEHSTLIRWVSFAFNLIFFWISNWHTEWMSFARSIERDTTITISKLEFVDKRKRQLKTMCGFNSTRLCKKIIKNFQPKIYVIFPFCHYSLLVYLVLVVLILSIPNNIIKVDQTSTPKIHLNSIMYSTHRWRN